MDDFCLVDMMIDAYAATTLLKKDLKNIQALNEIRTHGFCATRAMLSQLRSFFPVVL